MRLHGPKRGYNSRDTRHSPQPPVRLRPAPGRRPQGIRLNKDLAAKATLMVIAIMLVFLPEGVPRAEKATGINTNPITNPITYQLAHCPLDLDLSQADALSRCTLKARPAQRSRSMANAPQRLRLTLINAAQKPRVARLRVGPYYLAHIELLARQDSATQTPASARASASAPASASASASASTQPSTPALSASAPTGAFQPLGRSGSIVPPAGAARGLGGHYFNVLLEPGTNHFLLQIRAPGFAHLAIAVAPAPASAPAPAPASPPATATNAPPDAALDTLERLPIGISLHIGMLAMLAGIALVGVMLRPGAITIRLLLFNVAVLTQVGLGSGFLPWLLPGLPGGPAMTAFASLVAIRVALWSWLYQGLIEPHYRDHVPNRIYQRACQAGYAITAVVILAYVLDWLIVARLLSLGLILAIPLLHTVAAIKAYSLDPLLRRALIGSLLIYQALQIVALGIVVQNTGGSDLPLLITRALDLIFPLLAMGTVLLRNRASDQQLARAEQDLARNQAQLQAETAAREEKRTLIDMLTHEVRNPLATIQLASRGLQADPAGQDQRRFANIQAAIASINAVIERCNLSNRLDDDIPLRPQRLELGALMDSLAGQRGDNPRIVRHGETAATVCSDAQLLQILLGNLFDNALRYSPPETEIDVCIEQAPAEADSDWVISIRNAVDPAMRPDPAQMFQRYYRHERARQHGGSGLGLALSQRLAELLGGTLTAEVESSRVTLRLELPDHSGSPS